MTEPTSVSGSDSNPGIAVRSPSDLADVLRQFGGKVAGHLARRFPTLAEDERHDVLVDALVAFGRTYEPAKGPAGPWLLLLAHQRAIDWLRAAPGQPPTLGWQTHYDMGTQRDAPQRRLEYQERVEEIHAAIARLAPMERAVIEADLDAEGTANARRLARQLETTERAVYAARARAREKLLQWLSVD